MRIKMKMSVTVKATIKDAAQKLTGHRRRAFMAKVAEDYFEGSARQTETYLGWNRDNVQLGLHEHRSQILCADNYQARGRHKSEASLPQLEADIRALVDVQSQADPKFQTTFLYARISARAVREALVNEKGYEDTQLPSRQTIGAILNRLGYRLKKHKRQNP
jgi:Rhodopirellula transposase DDE domain